MLILPFTKNDLNVLPVLQPADWPDLGINYRYYLNSISFCNPLKIEIENKIVAVGTTILHDDSAWLAHIVVHPEFRNRGLGGIMTRALVTSLEKHHCKTISLIATPLGGPVYLKAGFIVEGEYSFFNNGSGKDSSSEKIMQANENYYAEILALDKFISGEDRSFRIEEFISGSYIYLEDNKLTGYFIPSFGDGFIGAINSIAGIELMKLRLQKNDIAILPSENKEGIKFLLENNYKNYRTAKRMRIGKKEIGNPILFLTG